jgi:hypothetical protein
MGWGVFKGVNEMDNRLGGEINKKNFLFPSSSSSMPLPQNSQKSL